MASYRERVLADLDRWIAAGLVSADKRTAILATLPETRRVDAATALAWVGGVLLGVAAIAFVSANWDVLPRLARFALILTLFLAAAGAGAWATRADRKLLANVALMLAALLFAAAVGLTGQIFDIVGDTQPACYLAAIGAAGLALAGRSAGAAIVALVLVGLGDLAGEQVFGWHEAGWNRVPVMIAAAPLGGWLALRWASAPLAHLSAMGIAYCLFWFAARYNADGVLLLLFAFLLGAMAGAARWLFIQGKQFASVFYGWFAWAAFGFFVAAGYATLHGSDNNFGLPHRIAWLLLAGGAVALGRFDRHAFITFLGVFAMLGAVTALLSDLGLDLMSAAGVFLVGAVIAIAGGMALRRRAKAS